MKEIIAGLLVLFATTQIILSYAKADSKPPQTSQPKPPPPPPPSPNPCHDHPCAGSY